MFNSIVSNGIERYYCLNTQSGYSTINIYDNDLSRLGYYHNYIATLYDMQYADDGLVFAVKINGLYKEQSFELPNEALEHMISGVYLINLEREHQSIATTKLERKKRKMREKLFNTEYQIAEKRDKLIEALSQRLKQQTKVITLFTIHCKVV